MSIVTGTPDTRTEHSQGLGALNLMMAMGIPALLAVIGILAEGGEAISWWGAAVWGAVAALMMSAFIAFGRAVGMTSMKMNEMLGSMFAAPHSSTARAIGTGIHLMTGAMLAIAWAYTMVLFDLAANWLTGLLWGAFVSILALLMISSIGVIHPKIRDGRHEDPGSGAMNYGKMTPVGIVMAHLVYGLVLGLLYQWMPLT